MSYTYIYIYILWLLIVREGQLAEGEAHAGLEDLLRRLLAIKLYMYVCLFIIITIIIIISIIIIMMSCIVIIIIIIIISSSSSSIMKKGLLAPLRDDVERAAPDDVEVLPDVALLDDVLAFTILLYNIL